MTRIQSTRRRFVQGTAATAAIAPFFIGKAHAAEPEFTLKLATVAPPGTPWEQLMRKFKKMVETNSEGRIKFKSYLGGVAGNETDTAESCKKGRLQGWGGSFTALESMLPELNAFELPYLFSDWKKGYKVLGAVRTQLHDLMWERGLKLALFSMNGFRSLGTTFPVNTLGDLKGHKIRSQQSDVHLSLWKEWKVSPVPMAITEVLSSLQTGVVDGYDNTELFSFAAALYMATTHWTLTRHIWQPAAVVYSRKFWETLPAELQAVLDPNQEEALKMEERGFRSIAAMQPQLEKNFVEAKIVVTDLEASERKKFESAAQKVHDKFHKGTSAAGKKLVDAIKAAL
jgi:TRAP-type C4-dicarboxylate transport system substrate-binding protein